MNKDLPINQLSWLCTHNAFNSEKEIGSQADSIGGTNQNHSIDDQLKDGVRVFMIDIHSFHGAPRVCHGEGGRTHYEDLCDLLVQYKEWLAKPANLDEIIILMLEVAGDVPPEWIRDTFAGAGPITRSADYDLGEMLYTHPTPNTPWPSVKDLVEAGKRVVVFRETDDGKGKTLDTGMEWYHDMWQHWIETPYGNSHWDDLQTHTYQLLRGNPQTAGFFNLNHFVNTGHTGSGSAGFAKAMNLKDYLTARALIAWKMQGRRPTLAVDFYKSLDEAAKEDRYNTAQTVRDLNRVPAISGSITIDGKPFIPSVVWGGIGKLTFADHGIDDYRYRKDTDGPQGAVPRSHGGYFCFPSDGTSAELTPSCPGFIFDPPRIEWDGLDLSDVVVTATPA